MDSEYHFYVPSGARNDCIPSNGKIYKYFGDAEKLCKTITNGIYLQSPNGFNDPFDEIYNNVPHLPGSNKFKYFAVPTYYEIAQYYLRKHHSICLHRINFESVLEILSNSKEYSGNNGIIDLDEAIKNFNDVSGFNEIPQKTVFDDISNCRCRLVTNVYAPKNKTSCFSEKYDDIPMWAYYGKGHEGYCLEFDINAIDPNNKHETDFVDYLFPIDYKSLRDKNNIHFIKSLVWEHESEWRITVNTQKDYLPVSCMTAIYFGCKNPISFIFDSTTKTSFPFRDYIKILTTIESRGKIIDLFRMETDNSEFKLNPQPLGQVGGGCI